MDLIEVDDPELDRYFFDFFEAYDIILYKNIGNQLVPLRPFETSFYSCRDVLQKDFVKWTPYNKKMVIGFTINESIIKRALRNFGVDSVFIDNAFRSIEKCFDVEPCQTFFNKARRLWFIQPNDFWRHPLRFSCLTGMLKILNGQKYRFSNGNLTKSRLVKIFTHSNYSYFENEKAIDRFLNGYSFIGGFFPTMGWAETFYYNHNVDKILGNKPIPYGSFKRSPYENNVTQYDKDTLCCHGEKFWDIHTGESLRIEYNENLKQYEPVR